MFSSHRHLKRKTPTPGVNREEFIEHLVEEYYTTTDSEAQEQVSANLANFAYDPINWQYMKNADVVKLFLELCASPNETLKLHGTAGLCNICLEEDIFEYTRKPENLRIIYELFLLSQNNEILLNCSTLIYQFLSNDKGRKVNILTSEILRRIQQLNNLFRSDKRLFNITSLLLEDFGKRYEFVEKPSK